MKNWIRNLLLLICSCVICLIIGEVVLRVVAPEFIEFQRAMVFSDLTVRKLKPNIERTLIHPANGEPDFYLATNSLGLRSDVETPFKAPPNTKRVLCLGDSYTFGFGVGSEETYPGYLEKILNDASNDSRRYQVINAGFASGLSTDAEYLYLREIGFKFSPDIVVLGFCLINDLIDISKNEWVVNKDGDLERIYNRTDRIIPVFVKRTAMVTVLRAFIKPKEILRKNREPLDAEAFARAQFALNKIKELGKKKGFKFLVIIIPPPLLVDKKENGSVWDECREELVGFCRQEDIPYIDLLGVLRTDDFLSGKAGKMHFNERGNRKVAKVIFERLKVFTDPAHIRSE